MKAKLETLSVSVLREFAKDKNIKKKLRAAMGYDPIHNRIGEGYLLGGPEE